MKKSLVLFVLILAVASPAHATNWRRAKGTLRMTYYSDNTGGTIDSIPLSGRRISINADLRKSSSKDGIKTACKDNKAVKQRVCTSSYYYEIQGNGSCLYETKMIFNNFTSTSRRLQAFYEGSMYCPTGVEAYAQYSGTITRS
jgi:hypothetical protein